MVKMGRSSPCKHQQCMAHGFHLSVCDVLYKSRSSENIDRQNTCEDYDILEMEYRHNVTDKTLHDKMLHNRMVLI